MLYSLYCSGTLIVKILPIKLCYVIADLVARAYFFCSKRDKGMVRKNMRYVLGDGTSPAEIDRHVLGVFINFAKYLVDFFKCSKLSREYILKNVEIEGMHHLDECLAKGKGAVIVAVHLGNWELGGAVVGMMGYPINAIVLKHKDERINNIFMGRRAVNNLRNIPLGMQLKRCFKVLRSNELLAIAADKDYTGSNEEVEFFGKKALMPKGAAALSLKTGAPIVFCAMIRQKNDTFRLVFEGPLRFKPTGDHDEDVRKLMREYIQIFEKYIRAYPDQWYAFEEIWDRKKITR